MSDSFRLFIEQIRSSANIVDVIGSYVSLRKKGSKHWACCPFHGEKTPSFSVDENKQLFYCFGCHLGGDIFKFIEKKEGLTFVEAAKRLAERYNIPIPEREKTASDLRFEKEFQRIVDINGWANKYYVACINHARGKKAKDYLLNRGITQKIIDAFQIGYALPGYGNLVKALPEKGIKQEEILSAGLSLKGRQDFPYDKFRDRIMIPIKDPRGRIVGFGGRVIDQGEPKYLNTGETKYFNKRYLLFAFDLARKAIQEKHQVIVVEGYMDAISLHAVGLNNVVASMGTAFSEQQAMLLKHNTKEIIFCYDSDDAGRRASTRAVSIARHAGIPSKVVMIPGSKDPDEYVRKEGIKRFLEVIDEAEPGLFFQINECIHRGKMDTLSGKINIVKECLPFLAEIENNIEIAEGIRELSKILVIDENIISDEFNKIRKNKINNSKQIDVNVVIQENNHSVEEVLLGLLLKEPSLSKIFEKDLSGLQFSNSLCSSIFEKIFKSQSEVSDVSRLNGILTEDETSFYTKLKLIELPPGDDKILFSDCIRKIHIENLENEYLKHTSLAVSFDKNNDERFTEELKICKEIRNEIKKISQCKSC